jgi:tRNA dimethylallyltransferase
VIRLLAVVGPTASGKSSLALELAARLHSEIISADSMQVYRGMEIGTAAPTGADLARVRHHFVSFLEPGEGFSAGAFAPLARAEVSRLNTEGKVAVVAGGSGLYLRALIDGLFDGPSADEALRDRLHGDARELGVPAMFERLAEVDSGYAETINPNDLRRIVRGLEVYEITGRPLSVLHREHRQATQPLGALQVGLNWPRAVLYDRINARVDQMLAAGFLDEVRTLLADGHGEGLARLRSLGYCEFIAHLQGECEYEEAVEAMKRNTRRFAKRQLSWFRSDARIRWIDVDPDHPPESHMDRVLGMVADGTQES